MDQIILEYKNKMQDSFRLISFDTNDTSIRDDDNKYQKVFTIQMYGVNEKGKTAF